MRSNGVSLALTLLCLRLRTLPSTEEERLYHDLKDRVERGKLRAKGQIEALQGVLEDSTAPSPAVSQSTPGQSTPTAVQTPRTPPTTKINANSTSNRVSVGGGQARRRSQMQLRSASGRESRTSRSQTNQTATGVVSNAGMWTPDATPIAASTAGSPLGPIGGVLNSYASPAVFGMSSIMSSPAASLMSASAAGKASRLFTAAVHGPPSGAVTDAAGADLDGVLREDLRAALGAVEVELQEQRYTMRRLNKDVRRLQ